MWWISFILFLHAAIALPTQTTERSLIPSVKIANGTVIGLGIGTVENFKGIPYAQPPTGPLRLKPPQPLKKGFGTFFAPLIPNSCPQFVASLDKSNLPTAVLGLLTNTPFLQQASFQSEG